MNVVIITTVNVADNLYKIKENCPDWMPIVAGDLNTPHEANAQICKEVGGVYLDPVTQMKLGFTHAAAVPWNCYARKNIAYLYALKEGAELFYITDDDNVPADDWADHVKVGMQECEIISSDSGWYNCYKGAQSKSGYISPRGYPWWLIGTNEEFKSRVGKENVGVLAGFPLGSPDVDAITRIIKNPAVTGYPNQDFILDKGTMSPYDTQNTIIIRDMMPANMLWSYSVTDPSNLGWRRFDDIIAGYVGQVIAWKYGYRVRYGRPFAYQERNPHDLMADLLAEIDGMRFQKKLIETLLNVELAGDSPSEDLRLVIYHMLEMLPQLPRCLKTYVNTWIDDLNAIGIC